MRTKVKRGSPELALSRILDAFAQELIDASDEEILEAARRILALYYEPDRGVMPKQAEINMAGMAKVVEMLAETGQIAGPLPPAERFVDLQYLQAAGLQ